MSFPFQIIWRFGRARARAWVAMAIVLGSLCFAPFSARGVILYRTGDPAANTTVPSNDPAGSGWNYIGRFGGFLGTPIAPHFFITAKHVDHSGSNLVYGGSPYALVGFARDPFSDLTIWQVAETFPTFAPLYTKMNEPGLRLVVMGCGTQRGAEVFRNSEFRGWYWGNSDGVQRWGENIVSSVVNFSRGPDDALYGTFDQNGLPDESHLSSGDSGGPLFLQDDGAWKLAGINYAVDGNFFNDNMGNGEFVAALFDMRNYYYREGDPPNYVEITGPAPVPSGFYSTRISSKLAWIYSVIDPAGDLDADGQSNLLEYAGVLNGPPPLGYGEPVVSLEGGFLALTYRKITNAPSLTYQVQVSTNLTSWENAASQDTVVRTDENVQTIKASVPIGSNPSLFLKLIISQ